MFLDILKIILVTCVELLAPAPGKEDI